MNDFYVPEKAMAESGKTTNTGDINHAYARSADQPPTRVDPHEDSGIRKFHTGGGRRKTGNQRTVLYVDDNPKAVRMLKFVIEGSGSVLSGRRRWESSQSIEGEWISGDLSFFRFELR